MTVPVDRLIFALDADLAPARAKYREFEADTAATAAKTQRIWETTGQSISRSVGVDRTFKDAAGSASVFSSALGDTNKAAEATARRFAELNGISRGMHGSINQATREFRALFDELSSGRTRMTPGTLAIIATRVFGISGATLAWAAAIAAIPIAFAAAAASAENSLARIRTAILLTQGASGLTVSAAGNIASQVAASGRLSEHGAMGIISGLAGGSVPASALAQATLAAANFSTATGGKEADAQKAIIEMFRDPSKAAADLNKEFNLLTDAQTREVEDLQKSGEIQRAGQIVLDHFSATMDRAAGSVSGFSAVLNKLEVGFGGLIGLMAHTVGAGLTPQQELADLRAGKGRNIVGPGGTVIPGLPDSMVAAREAELIKQIADQERDAKKTEREFTANQAVAGAMADVVKGTGAFNEHLRQMQQELNRDQFALRLSKDARGADTRAITEQRDALARAIPLERLRTPQALAAQVAADALTAARAGPDRQATVAAQLAARRQFEANLANPSMTTAQANAIFQSQMQGAQAGNIKVGERLGEKQAQNLAVMKAEGDEQLKIAAAFDLSTAAGDRAKFAAEARIAVVRKEIAANGELIQAESLRAKAFANEVAQLAEKAANENNILRGLQGEVAAGGNPVAVARANAFSQAFATTQKARDLANTPEEQQRVFREFNREFAANLQRLELDGEKALQATAFGTRREIAGLQNRTAAFAAGGTPDDMRHVEAVQKAFDEVSQKFEVGTPLFEKYFEIQAKLNIQVSDLNDSFSKLSAEAQSLASDITGPLQQFLTQGGNPLAVLAQIGQNILGTLVKNQLIDPLQKKLEGLFGGLLGAGAPGSSPTSPSYTWVLNNTGGGLDANASHLFDSLGGALGDVAGNTTGSDVGTVSRLFSIFGGGDTGAGISDIAQAGKTAGESGGFFSDIFDWFGGLFDSGGTIGAGEWGIKSGMPEIIQGGTSGVSIMPLAAPAVTASLSRIVEAANGNKPSQGTMRGGDTHIYNFGPNSDKKSVLTARSQLEAMATRVTEKGRRTV